MQDSDTSFNPLSTTLRNSDHVGKQNDYEVNLMNKSKLFLNEKMNKERSYNKFNKSMNIFNHKARVVVPLDTLYQNANPNVVKNYGRFNGLSKLYFESKNNIKLPLK